MSTETTQHSVRFFDPRLGTVKGLLIPSVTEPNRICQQQSVALLDAELRPEGEVRLQLRAVNGGEPWYSAPLRAVHDATDGSLTMELADGGQLSFDATHQAGARDIVLSLANRPTPFF